MHFRAAKWASKSEITDFLPLKRLLNIHVLQTPVAYCKKAAQ
jgi:hypothetical protein